MNPVVLVHAAPTWMDDVLADSFPASDPPRGLPDGEICTDHCVGEAPRCPRGEPDASNRRSRSTLHRDDFQWPP